MSRYKWTLAIILLSIIVTAGCASKSTTSEPNIPAARTPEQESSNTPARMDPPPTVVETIPSADGVASAFLNAWERNDFLGMYSLLSPASQSMIDKQLFVERYQDAQDAATVVTVMANPVSILQDGHNAQTTFHLTWQTALFGDIERDMSLSLIYESSRWMVSWSDALILPELGGGNTLFLEYQIPVRANIYDRNGLGLAVEGKAVNVGVVPAEIVDEASLLLILEEILDLPIDEIREKYVTVDPTWYVPLGDAPAEAVALKLDALQPNIESGGIQLKERKTRLYREGGVAPHVLGYTGAISAEALEYWDTLGYRGDERVGIAGVESWGESYLGGARGGTLYLNSPT
ncbi:MAG: NTF2-like N-terminal transpeptidase domain-containing protein, partial [Chloroflexota bacterium]